MGEQFSIRFENGVYANYREKQVDEPENKKICAFKVAAYTRGHGTPALPCSRSRYNVF